MGTIKQFLKGFSNRLSLKLAKAIKNCSLQQLFYFA